MAASDPLQQLQRDVQRIFGGRLQSLVVYGERARTRRQHDAHHAHGVEEAVRTMVIVDAITGDDLRACAQSAAGWHDNGLATPLLLASQEFERSLDVFPLEFGSILADHAVVAGDDPFAPLTVALDDLRRACEVQARSHLLHLREGYVETGGNGGALALLIVESAPALAALVTTLARLEAHGAEDPAAAARYAERTLDLTPGSIAEIVALTVVQEISSDAAQRLFPPYLESVQRLVTYVDGWSRRA